MQFAFDLISDLHLDTWNRPFDWTGQATSPHCIVAGDVCKDRGQLVRFLKHLGTCYQAVFYLDGNEEHSLYMDRISESYKDLVNKINKIPNVVYLQDNVVVINGVAVLGTNGWWGFDLDLAVDPEQSRLWYQEKSGYSDRVINAIKRSSTTDANYMISSVKRLQTHPDVKKIVMVTHTVPRADLISHDPTIVNSMRFNYMGNRYMNSALDADTEKKIDTWCFGHYHNKIDQYRDSIRYVNNCRGRGDSTYSQWVYNPLRVVVEY